MPRSGLLFIPHQQGKLLRHEGIFGHVLVYVYMYICCWRRHRIQALFTIRPVAKQQGKILLIWSATYGARQVHLSVRLLYACTIRLKLNHLHSLSESQCPCWPDLRCVFKEFNFSNPLNVRLSYLRAKDEPLVSLKLVRSFPGPDIFCMEVQ